MERTINGAKVLVNDNGVFVYTDDGLIRITPYPSGLGLKSEKYGTILNAESNGYHAVVKVVKP